MRRAKLFDRVMSTKTIYIDENPIVGTVGRGRNYCYSFPEYDCGWMGDPAAWAGDRGAVGFSKEDKHIVEETMDYWRGRSQMAISNRIYDETHPGEPDSNTLFWTGFTATAVSPLPMGLPMPDWAELINNGLNNVTRRNFF